MSVIQPQIAQAIHQGKVSDFDTFLSDVLIIPYLDFHKQHLLALKKLGPLKADQMYGYVPVLALGGNGSLKETKVVQMREYLFMVAEIATAARREGWNPLGLPTESAP